MINKAVENKFDRTIAQRFVNDMNLPIQVIDAETFYYWLVLFQDEYNSLGLWNDMWDEIDASFNGDATLFLQHYYDVRDKVIKEVTENEAFKKFNECDMNRFKIETPLNPKSKEFYNEENVGKYYLSFDLVKSNIQALNYADTDILFNSKTYDEFISRFTNSEYIKRSKYFRQVVFGQMNPKRHITIAKYLISKVYEICKNKGLNYTLVSVSSDEIVFEIPEATFEHAEIVGDLLPKLVKNELGLEIRPTWFKLEMYYLKTRNCPKLTAFYVKRDGNVGKKVKGVPLQYAGLVHKLLNNEMLLPIDYVFQYEKCKCVFDEIFEIEKIQPK